MKYIAIIALLFVYGCATSPEAKLKQGYDTASATVVTATTLLNRGAISSDDAIRVLTLGETAKASLDAGKNALMLCRAQGEKKCSGAGANIQLGSGVLIQLEQYLEKAEQQ